MKLFLFLFLTLPSYASFSQDSRQDIEAAKKRYAIPADCFVLHDSSYSFSISMDKHAFDTLHSIDLLASLVRPMHEMLAEQGKAEGMKKLSRGQKLVYFFFWFNHYMVNDGLRDYLMEIHNYHAADYIVPMEKGMALGLIPDKGLTDVLGKIEVLRKKYTPYFTGYNAKMYDKETRADFLEIDNAYNNIRSALFSVFEKYIRDNPQEFVTLHTDQ